MWGLQHYLKKAEYTEEHFHNRERWIGLRVPQTATEWADYATLNPFILESGNNAWGAAEQLLGSADTPHFSGNRRFDFHRALVVANSANTIYRIQFIWSTVDAATGITDESFSEFMFIRDAASSQRKIFETWSRKIAVGTKVWGRCWNATNLATVSLFCGLHEYD